MNRIQVISAALALSACTLLSVGAQAQAAPTAPVQIVIAGSSAMFADTGYTAVENSASLGYNPCGPYLWTGASKPTNITSGPYIADTRATIPNEPGNVWISWNVAAQPTSANPPTKVCAYISVDSVVGVRAAMANPSASLVIPSNLVGAADAGKLSALSSAASIQSLPAYIQALFNSGQPITVAASDVRPEDAKFATVRALAPLGGALNDPSPYAISNSLNPMGTQLFQAKGLGYASVANANIGVTIKSTQANGTRPPRSTLRPSVRIPSRATRSTAPGLPFRWVPVRSSSSSTPPTLVPATWAMATAPTPTWFPSAA